MGFLEPEVLASNLVNILSSESLYYFGVLTSAMHMAWVRHVCGRLKSDYRYSAKLVYNNFPWAENPTEKQKAAVETKAQRVLDVRAKYPATSLADLYDPLATPRDLTEAHRSLDRAVDHCYRRQPFNGDLSRITFLFDLYEKYTGALFRGPKHRR